MYVTGIGNPSYNRANYRGHSPRGERQKNLKLQKLLVDDLIMLILNAQQVHPCFQMTNFYLWT